MGKGRDGTIVRDSRTKFCSGPTRPADFCPGADPTGQKSTETFSRDNRPSLDKIENQENLDIVFHFKKYFSDAEFFFSLFRQKSFSGVWPRFNFIAFSFSKIK